jgi:transposase
MSKQKYPTELTDSQWEIIQKLIPPAKSRGRPRSPYLTGHYRRFGDYVLDTDQQPEPLLFDLPFEI